ncbi:hypothetical protein [Streptomyces ipomoeae]|uniref:hypothetical protein n=1 Tax=Streptomyces ipomoeae TaxID=103232 RepID=UPI0015F10A9B|nr:hypothetical protein [Streptomyces ipomoeae]MDX2932386.1 hypothetical protein [Streptomyces ipomoeae]
MDWPLSAMASALAGIVATFVVDRDRWKRAQQADAQTVLREMARVTRTYSRSVQR